MDKLLILAVLPFAISAPAVAFRRASLLWRCVGAGTLTAALGVMLFASSRRVPSTEELPLIALVVGAPVAASFVAARLTREHSPYFGALLMSPLAFVATLVFVVSIAVDAGWLRP